MISFVCDSRPRSVQAKRTNKYKNEIKEAFSKYYPEVTEKLNYSLYGLVYYFHKRPTDIDADNLSKPIWDALESILYDNDKIIKIRKAGVYQINKTGESFDIDITNMPSNVSQEFLEYLDTKEHILYIEIGKVCNEMYEIGVEL